MHWKGFFLDRNLGIVARFFMHTKCKIGVSCYKEFTILKVGTEGQSITLRKTSSWDNYVGSGALEKDNYFDLDDVMVYYSSQN